MTATWARCSWRERRVGAANREELRDAIDRITTVERARRRRVPMIERVPMPDPDLDEICRVLGVPRDADAATVKKAYRALAVRHHPDRNPDDAEARRRFDEANHAYA